MKKLSFNKSKRYLTEIIETKRKEILEVDNFYGIHSNKTLKHSRELDILILKYQK